MSHNIKQFPSWVMKRGEREYETFSPRIAEAMHKDGWNRSQTWIYTTCIGCEECEEVEIPWT